MNTMTTIVDHAVARHPYVETGVNGAYLRQLITTNLKISLGPRVGQLYWKLLDEVLATYVDWDAIAAKRESGQQS